MRGVFGRHGWESTHSGRRGRRAHNRTEHNVLSLAEYSKCPCVAWARDCDVAVRLGHHGRLYCTWALCGAGVTHSMRKMSHVSASAPFIPMPFTRTPSWARRKSKDSAASSNQIVLHDTSAPPPPTGAGGADALSEQQKNALKEAEAERMKQESEDLAELLPLRKPKHVLDGTASGLKLVVGGVAAGAVGVVAMPAIGAYQ